MEVCQELVGKQGAIYIIGQIHRPGTMSFMVELEHTHYDPANEELNEAFHVFTLMYNNAMFFVIELDPYERPDTATLHALALRYRLELVNGKPYNGKYEFPARCAPDTCFTLETRNHDELSRLGNQLVIEELGALTAGRSASSAAGLNVPEPDAAEPPLTPSQCTTS